MMNQNCQQSISRWHRSYGEVSDTLLFYYVLYYMVVAMCKHWEMHTHSLIILLRTMRKNSCMATIKFNTITKCYAGRPAVDAVTFEVPEGCICILVGTSGSGKTTLLRMVNRLIEPTSGEILIDGKNVLMENPIQLRRRIGYVIQQVGLFPHMTITENVRVTAEIAGGWTKQRLAARVDELL